MHYLCQSSVIHAVLWQNFQLFLERPNRFIQSDIKGAQRNKSTYLILDSFFLLKKNEYQIKTQCSTISPLDHHQLNATHQLLLWAIVKQGPRVWTHFFVTLLYLIIITIDKTNTTTSDYFIIKTHLIIMDYWWSYLTRDLKVIKQALFLSGFHQITKVMSPYGNIMITALVFFSTTKYI